MEHPFVWIAAILFVMALALGLNNAVIIFQAVANIVFVNRKREQKRKAFFLKHPVEIEHMVNTMEFCNVYWNDLLPDEKISIEQAKLHLEYAMDQHDEVQYLQAMRYTVSAGMRIKAEIDSRN